MNARVLNGCLALGWLMFVGGCCLVKVAFGLAAGGLLLLGLTILMARLGGIYLPKGDA